MSDTKNLNIPLLPLRDVVIFPSVVTPLFVGREKSIKDYCGYLFSNYRDIPLARFHYFCELDTYLRSRT